MVVVVTDGGSGAGEVGPMRSSQSTSCCADADTVLATNASLSERPTAVWLREGACNERVLDVCMRQRRRSEQHRR